MVKARLAMSPRFDRVSNDEALRVIGEHDPELLTDAWTLRSSSGENMGADGFLTVDMDLRNDDGSFKVYLMEIYQFSSEVHKGDVVCEVMVWEYTDADAVGQLVSIDRIEGRARQLGIAAGGEFSTPSGPRVAVLKASTYTDAVQEAAKLLNIDADQAQTARLTRRLRRLAAEEDLVHLLGTYTSKRDLAKAAEPVVLNFEERAAEQTEAAAQELIDQFIAAHAVDVAEALINLQAGRHQDVHRAAVDDEAVQAVADQLVAPHLGDVLFIDRDGFLQVARQF